MEKSELLNYRALVLEVRHLRGRVDKLERAKSPASEDACAEAVLALYRARVEEKTEALIAIETAIESLDSPAARLLMRLRYIEGRSWVSVCGALRPLKYSERRVYRLHGTALMKLKEL